MRDRLSHWWPVSLAAALALLTWWLEGVVNTPPRPPGSNRHDPDFIVDKARSVQLDKAGNPLQILSADRLVHYPDDDTSRLTNPDYHRQADEHTRLGARSATALIHGEGDRINLQGGAVMTRERDGKTLTLKTEHITVFPDRNYAETEAPVLVTGQNTTVHAVGLKLDATKHTVVFESQVRADYRKH